MKKIFLVILLLLTSGTAFSQYDVVDSVNTALQIARAAVALDDSGTVYATPYDLSQIAITLDSDTLSYSTAEIDSLLGIVAAGDSIDYTAAELELVLDNLAGGTADLVLTKTNSTDFNYSWQPAAGGADTTVVRDLIAEVIPINKTTYVITEIAYIDTFLTFWADNAIIIDSIKYESTDSVRVQINLDDGSRTSNVYASGIFINGNLTSTIFSDNTLVVNDKAKLYFIYIGDNLAYLRIKFYWRYL